MGGGTDDFNREWQRQLNSQDGGSGGTPPNPFGDDGIDIATMLKLIEQNSKNEDQFREFKPVVLSFIFLLIGVQLFVMNLIVLIIVISSIVDSNGFWFIHNFDAKIATPLFGFLKYYISATIVELLAMLFFMIRSIFNQSILKLADIFSGHNKKKSE